MREGIVMSGFGRVGAIALVLFVASCSAAKDDTGATGSGSSAPAPVESATTTTAPPAFAPVGPGAAIEPGHQYTFGTVQSGGQKLLTVGPDGVVTLTDHLEDRALFVPTPVKAGAEEYLLKTGKIVKGGEALCLVVNSPGGSEPLNLKTAACDAGKDDQVFTFPASADNKGRLIEIAGLFAFAEGGDGTVVVQESGEGDAMSAFTLRDQGKATIPQVG